MVGSCVGRLVHLFVAWLVSWWLVRSIGVFLVVSWLFCVRQVLVPLFLLFSFGWPQAFENPVPLISAMGMFQAVVNSQNSCFKLPATPKFHASSSLQQRKTMFQALVITSSAGCKQGEFVFQAQLSVCQKGFGQTQCLLHAVVCSASCYPLS